MNWIYIYWRMSEYCSGLRKKGSNKKKVDWISPIERVFLSLQLIFAIEKFSHSKGKRAVFGRPSSLLQTVRYNESLKCFVAVCWNDVIWCIFALLVHFRHTIYLVAEMPQQKMSFSFSWWNYLWWAVILPHHIHYPLRSYRSYNKWRKNLVLSITTSIRLFEFERSNKTFDSLTT